MLSNGHRNQVFKLLISVYPEYHEWMDNTLNLGDMRKFKFQKNTNLKSTQANQRKSNESGSLKQKAFEINKKLNCNEVNFTFGNNKDSRRIINFS